MGGQVYRGQLRGHRAVCSGAEGEEQDEEVDWCFLDGLPRRAPKIWQEEEDSSQGMSLESSSMLGQEEFAQFDLVALWEAELGGEIDTTTCAL